MRIDHNRPRYPLGAQTLLWAVVAAGYVWLLGPPGEGVERRQLAEREASELAVADSLQYDPERWEDTVVSPRRFTVEVLAAVGFPLQASAEEETPLSYSYVSGKE